MLILGILNHSSRLIRGTEATLQFALLHGMLLGCTARHAVLRKYAKYASFMHIQTIQSSCTRCQSAESTDSSQALALKHHFRAFLRAFRPVSRVPALHLESSQRIFFPTQPAVSASTKSISDRIKRQSYRGLNILFSYCPVLRWIVL